MWLCWAKVERCCWGQVGKTKAVVVTTRARRMRRGDPLNAKEGLMHAKPRGQIRTQVEVGGCGVTMVGSVIGMVKLVEEQLSKIC